MQRHAIVPGPRLDDVACRAGVRAIHDAHGARHWFAALAAPARPRSLAETVLSVSKEPSLVVSRKLRGHARPLGRHLIQESIGSAPPGRRGRLKDELRVLVAGVWQ